MVKRKNDLTMEKFFTPLYYDEASQFKKLILQNWWSSGAGEVYQDFAKECKTSVSLMASTLSDSVLDFYLQKINKDALDDIFRNTLDLLDYYITLKK